ncbi:unnamed protein product [Amoebophrya sp. A120]|nr:unnamed protein product [Amoebophrya sp. A120]|eukprot:GSA120T00005682001.1
MAAGVRLWIAAALQQACGGFAVSLRSFATPYPVVEKFTSPLGSEVDFLSDAPADHVASREHPNSQDQTADTTCSVCLESDAPLIPGPYDCSHGFCGDCRTSPSFLVPALRRCPMCRRDPMNLRLLRERLSYLQCVAATTEDCWEPTYLDTVSGSFIRSSKSSTTPCSGSCFARGPREHSAAGSSSTTLSQTSTAETSSGTEDGPQTGRNGPAATVVGRQAIFLSTTSSSEENAADREASVVPQQEIVAHDPVRPYTPPDLSSDDLPRIVEQPISLFDAETIPKRWECCGLLEYEDDEAAPEACPEEIGVEIEDAPDDEESGGPQRETGIPLPVLKELAQYAVEFLDDIAPSAQHWDRKKHERDPHWSLFASCFLHQDAPGGNGETGSCTKRDIDELIFYLAALKLCLPYPDVGRVVDLLPLMTLAVPPADAENPSESSVDQSGGAEAESAPTLRVPAYRVFRTDSTVVIYDCAQHRYVLLPETENYETRRETESERDSPLLARACRSAGELLKDTAVVTKELLASSGPFCTVTPEEMQAERKRQEEAAVVKKSLRKVIAQFLRHSSSASFFPARPPCDAATSSSASSSFSHCLPLSHAEREHRRRARRKDARAIRRLLDRLPLRKRSWRNSAGLAHAGLILFVWTLVSSIPVAVMMERRVIAVVIGPILLFVGGFTEWRTSLAKQRKLLDAIQRSSEYV